LSLRLSDTTITLARLVPAGEFSRLAATGPSAAEQAFSNPVALCRVAATLKPSPDSDIKVEVWLPAAGWNGKFQAVGNGGWGGWLSYSAMSQALENRSDGVSASGCRRTSSHDAAIRALRNDPSRDIRALAAVEYTIRDGKVIYRSSR
jgi:feruloyl esterase